ncbi:transcriptional regulator [Neoasaia chiangmaiensis NBRC 101099]|uniref:UPF0301 protein A0U93_14395 n=1 Tax=Neoasaia chiangmaiensis TaxID=320497 RepID=A0A1U9KUY0_9PROT|nr:YqgE/AlgH family protein [Neoasaia chiangmaiensis]AQS89572.1 hypothetical protein A0U93_14395 [Neoasaia chiangmaiensis]GBR40424.1 transcriptional regulator [Neoasaia chiangmaiensis NBRC 101099]GEN13906.1 UPF0301 protein [Neoasaia chiangmaiensis]
MNHDVTDPDTGLTGRLLVASPALSTSEFAQTVIYICAHSREDGAMGLIVNKRLSQPSLDEMLTQLDITPNPPARRIGLCSGGPLDNARGFVLHSSDWSSEGSLHVDDGTVLSVGLDVLRAIAEGDGPQKALLALGHAAWGAGQVEDEMIRGNAWLIAPASDEILYGADHQSKWRRALAAIDIDPLTLPDVVGHA